MVELTAFAVGSKPAFRVLAEDLDARLALETRFRAVDHLDFFDEAVALEREPLGAAVLLDLGVDDQIIRFAVGVDDLQVFDEDVVVEHTQPDLVELADFRADANDVAVNAEADILRAEQNIAEFGDGTGLGCRRCGLGGLGVDRGRRLRGRRSSGALSSCAFAGLEAVNFKHGGTRLCGNNAEVDLINEAVFAAGVDRTGALAFVQDDFAVFVVNGAIGVKHLDT